MANYYCEYCGTKYSSVTLLTGSSCHRHPNGPNKGKHKLYEGSEKRTYTCKYCGTAYSSLTSLTGSCLPSSSQWTKQKENMRLLFKYAGSLFRDIKCMC
jgi:DNA-directed RNA polymerase subunit RPC12/RpoP